MREVILQILAQHGDARISNLAKQREQVLFVEHHRHRRHTADWVRQAAFTMFADLQ